GHPRGARRHVAHRRRAPRVLGAFEAGADPHRAQDEPRLRNAAVTHDVIVVLAALGVAGQVLAAVLLLLGLAWAAGARSAGNALRRTIEGYELWLAFLVSAGATGGGLFFSAIAHFTPCGLFWFPPILLYPLPILTTP